MDKEELYDKLADELSPDWIRWALDKLESKELVERLSDGNLVKTEPGVYMDRALSGIPRGAGMPVNPLIYRVINAFAEVGTIFETENEIRVAPRKLDQAIKISGLRQQTFQKAAEAATGMRINPLKHKVFIFVFHPQEKISCFTI